MAEEGARFSLLPLVGERADPVDKVKEQGNAMVGVQFSLLPLIGERAGLLDSKGGKPIPERGTCLVTNTDRGTNMLHRQGRWRLEAQGKTIVESHRRAGRLVSSAEWGTGTLEEGPEGPKRARNGGEEKTAAHHHRRKPGTRIESADTEE